MINIIITLQLLQSSQLFLVKQPWYSVSAGEFSFDISQIDVNIF